MKSQLKAMIEASMFYNFGAGFLLPIYAIFIEGIGGSILDAGIAWTINYLMVGIFILIFGKLEDAKLDKKNMVVLGYLILAFATLSYTFVETTTQLFVVQFFLGLGAGVLIPGWYALYGHFTQKGKEASEWSYWSAGRNIVIGLSGLVGAAIVDFFSWNALFMVMFAFEFAAGITIFIYLKRELPKIKKIKTKKKSKKQIKKEKKKH